MLTAGWRTARKHKHQCGPKTDGRPAFAVSFGTAQWFPSPYSFPRKPLCVRKAGAGRPAVQPITSIVAVPIARVKYGHVLTHFYCVSGRQTNAVTAPCAAALSQACLYAQRLQGFVWRAEAAQGVPVCAALVTPVPPALRHPDNGKLEGCRAHRPATAPSNAGGGRPYTGSPRWAGVAGNASIMADAHAQGEPPQPSIQLKRLHASTAARAGNSAHPGKWFLPPSIWAAKNSAPWGTQAADVALPTPCPCPCPWGWGAPTWGQRAPTIHPAANPRGKTGNPPPVPPSPKPQVASLCPWASRRQHPLPPIRDATKPPATYSWGMGTSARRQRQCPSAPRAPVPKTP